jgi:hypothetical protein
MPDELGIVRGHLAVLLRTHVCSPAHDFSTRSLTVNRHVVFFSALLLALGGLSQDAYAKRGIPLPIVWGQGEKVTQLGELPPDVSRAVAAELGTSVTVAFLHERVHVFWLDLWTWHGRHVLHGGDKYWEPDSSTWQQLIGDQPAAKFGTPIFYRVPMLAAALVVGVVAWGVRKQCFKTPQEKLDVLMKDKRYQRALEILFGPTIEDAAKVATTLDEQKFQQAKSQLVLDDVGGQTAETNLRLVADAILATTNAQVDAALNAASQLAQQGEREQSAEIYNRLVAKLPENDERWLHAQKCLAVIRDQPSTAALEQGRESATAAGGDPILPAQSA